MFEKDGNKMLTKEDVAEIFSVPMTTVQSWMNAGRIPYVKIGGTIRILPSDIEEIIQKNRVIGKDQDNTSEKED